MEKIKIASLDLPIIRSCNLACMGCMTHSNHKNIKGLIKPEDSTEWLKFWADRIDVPAVTIFGGEPLLHPQLLEWVTTVKQVFGSKVGVNLNTNGYYLDTLFDKIPELFNENIALSLIVSAQTQHEPYLSTVKHNFDLLRTKIIEYHLSLGAKKVYWELWLDEYNINTKRWYRLIVDGKNYGIGFTMCEQYQSHWTSFYEGYADKMRPVYSYDDKWDIPNHSKCQVTNFITLYNGRMYKCPPIGVLEHTLKTFDLLDNEQWQPFLDNIKTVGIDSTDDEIIQWFDNQKDPEKLCNMCGFSGPARQEITAEQRSHFLKENWKYIPIKAS